MPGYVSEERLTYGQLKRWALDAYFDFCRDSGLAQHAGHEQVMGRLVYTFEDGFERPLEDLMWNVIVLILSCGLHAEWENKQREVIVESIQRNGLENLLADVPASESDVFRHDLKILNLIKNA
jgi:hypothetical protein